MIRAVSIFSIALLILVAGFGVAIAQVDYQPISGLPGLDTDHVTVTSTVTVIINLVMGVGVLLAVLMVAFGGLEYMGSDVVTSKEKAKERITSAIVGLLLLLGTYLLLYTINPCLVRIDVFNSGSSCPQLSGGGSSSFSSQAPPTITYSAPDGTLLEAVYTFGGTVGQCTSINETTGEVRSCTDSERRGVSVLPVSTDASNTSFRIRSGDLVFDRGGSGILKADSVQYDPQLDQCVVSGKTFGTTTEREVIITEGGSFPATSGQVIQNVEISGAAGNTECILTSGRAPTRSAPPVTGDFPVNLGGDLSVYDVVDLGPGVFDETQSDETKFIDPDAIDYSFGGEEILAIFDTDPDFESAPLASSESYGVNVDQFPHEPGSRDILVIEQDDDMVDIVLLDEEAVLERYPEGPPSDVLDFYSCLSVQDVVWDQDLGGFVTPDPEDPLGTGYRSVSNHEHVCHVENKDFVRVADLRCQALNLESGICLSGWEEKDTDEYILARNAEIDAEEQQRRDEADKTIEDTTRIIQNANATQSSTLCQFCERLSIILPQDPHSGNWFAHRDLHRGLLVFFQNYRREFLEREGKNNQLLRWSIYEAWEPHTNNFGCHNSGTCLIARFKFDFLSASEKEKRLASTLAYIEEQLPRVPIGGSGLDATYFRKDRSDPIEQADLIFEINGPTNVETRMAQSPDGTFVDSATLHEGGSPNECVDCVPLDPSIRLATSIAQDNPIAIPAINKVALSVINRLRNTVAGSFGEFEVTQVRTNDPRDYPDVICFREGECLNMIMLKSSIWGPGAVFSEAYHIIGGPVRYSRSVNMFYVVGTQQEKDAILEESNIGPFIPGKIKENTIVVPGTTQPYFQFTTRKFIQ